MSNSCASAPAGVSLASQEWKERFDQILGEAARRVRREWFELPVSEEGAVYRERVYCYELYHQMRCLWPKESEYFLSGEIDKRNHRYFRDCQPKPDFLVHVPGRDRNHLIIEVKSCEGASVEGIENDIDKLIKFTMEIEAPYHRGIYLIYGNEAQSAADDVRARLRARRQRAAEVEVWVHSRVGEPAVRVKTAKGGSGLTD